MSQPSQESLRTLESLRRAVAKALERKRRLGQYAVIWRDGRPVKINPDHIMQLREEPGEYREGD